MQDQTREEYETRILKVQLYIQRHLDQNLELEDLARFANFSPFHFHRIFKAMTGEPLNEYIRRLRMEMSAAMLFYNKLSIADIAARNGYNNSHSFRRAFKGHFGVAPRDYRKVRKVEPINISSDHLNHYKFKLNRETGATMTVKIEDFPERTVAFVRHVGPYKECVKAWIKLCDQKNLTPYIRSEHMIGIGHDDPEITPPNKIRYDACVEINPDCPPLEGISRQKLVGGKYAVIMYRGPYDGLYAVNCFFYGQWLPGHRYELRLDPQFYIHYNRKDKVPPEELLTALCVPIKQ